MTAGHAHLQTYDVQLSNYIHTLSSIGTALDLNCEDKPWVYLTVLYILSWLCIHSTNVQLRTQSTWSHLFGRQLSSLRNLCHVGPYSYGECDMLQYSIL